MQLYNGEELRNIEKGISEMFLAGQIHGPVHLSGGNEKALIKIFKRIKQEDWVLSTHRYHYHYLLKGGSPKRLLEHMQQGCTIHTYDRSINFLTSAIVGGCAPIAVGIGKAQQLGGRSSHVWCFLGDAAADSGHVWEAIRYADDYHLPVTFVLEDNQFSCDTPYTARWTTKLMKQYVQFGNVEYYKYKRIYPHVGVGQWVSF